MFCHKMVRRRETFLQYSAPSLLSPLPPPPQHTLYTLLSWFVGLCLQCNGPYIVSHQLFSVSSVDMQ